MSKTKMDVDWYPLFVRLPKPVAAKLKKLSAKLGQPMASFVRGLILRELNK